MADRLIKMDYDHGKDVVMRTNEFEKKLKAKVRLGEIATSMCFRNIDGNYTLAVLCIEPIFTEDELAIKAIPAMIYWDNNAKV